jgi:hypothetical protein
LYRVLQTALDEKKETKSSTNTNERETNRLPVTRDDDFRPRLPRGAREREPAVVLPEIRRGDRGEGEASARTRSSSRSKSRERGRSPPFLDDL